ncbi:hypothetical protein [Sabulibacter ruber]|uniref:hypothetical protein n=1 Tax=Sabulibacter ruber TaxID=2811901 RepID=UPI001A966F07|nr:hypothetical protein [Sabulibacter ruber]
MKKLTKQILLYLITSLSVIGIWKILTSTDNYAWSPEGKELLMLEIALNAIFFYKSIFWLVTVNLIVCGLLQLRKKNFRTAGVVVALILTYHFFVGKVIDNKCAFHYYSVFQNQSVAEGYIVRPIEEAGYEIGPILTGKIEKKEMKSRVYAMLGLQRINYKPAIETMKRILLDSSENVEYRANAYEFLRTVESDKSKQVIKDYKLRATDSVAKEVVRFGEYFYGSR